MIKNRRQSAARFTPILLLTIAALILLSLGLIPASRSAIARTLSLDDGTAWLEMVDKPSQLYTEYSFAHLSGKLIIFGALNASTCQDSGLNKEGDATDCGIKAAQTVANEWQNRYNKAILETSKQQNIPPRLIKNIFAWESQFWPETTYKNTFEFGLGHVTLNGADSALRWDTGLYQEICLETFNKELCQKEYGDQSEGFRSSLQGVLVQKINADCSTCRFNLDFKQAEKSIPYIGKTLLANQAYVRYAIKVFSFKNADDLVSSDDIWRFTLVAYNAGPGCFRSALSNTYYRGLNLTWSNLKKYLEPACTGSIPYVEFISKVKDYHPDNDPALHPTATPEVLPTPTLEPISLEAPHSETELVVKISPEHLDAALKTLQTLNVSSDQVSDPVDPFGTRVIQVSTDQYSAVLDALRSNPDVTSAEPNYFFEAASLPVGYPNDPQYAASQLNLPAIQVPTAWDTLSIVANPGDAVTVAVLDSGVNATHEDLTGRMWSNTAETNCSNGIDDDHNGYTDDCNGWDFVNIDNNPADDHNHGTEMAGVIAATTNNAKGIAGIAPNARILAVKILGGNAVGSHVNAAKGIYYAANLGAQIIYIGGAGTSNSAVLRNAIAYAVSKGILVIAPAGNTNGTTVNMYPASYPGVISVTATDNAGTIAAFSTKSTNISLAAPGVSIVSTGLFNTYQTASGTSLAAAHVAGVAALLAGQPRFVNHNDLVRSALTGSALDLGTAGRDSTYGYGLVRTNNALTSGTVTATVTITSPTASSIYSQGQLITFTASAVDNSSNSLNSSLVWTSNVDGNLGTGPTFNSTRLTPAAHTITAAVVINNVTIGTASVNIRVLEISGPHGKFPGNASVCADCHDSHSVDSPDFASARSSNAFCINCHNGQRAKAVSTHSNIGNNQGGFEILCIQCHEPHGNTPNLFTIRTQIYTGSLPQRFDPNGRKTSLISFTILNTNQLFGVCNACHQDNGLIGHSGGQLCITCHYHDQDGNPNTRDGFLPNNPPPQLTPMAQNSPTPTATHVSPTAVKTPIPTPTREDAP